MKKLALTFALLATPALAQQQQLDPQAVIDTLRAQRDQAMDQAAMLGAQVKMLTAEMARVKDEQAKAEKKKDEPKN